MVWYVSSVVCSSLTMLVLCSPPWILCSFSYYLYYGSVNFWYMKISFVAAFWLVHLLGPLWPLAVSQQQQCWQSVGNISILVACYLPACPCFFGCTLLLLCLEVPRPFLSLRWGRSLALSICDIIYSLGLVTLMVCLRTFLDVICSYILGFWFSWVTW